MISYEGAGIDLVRMVLFMVAFWGISLEAFIWTLRIAGGRRGKQLPTGPAAAADGPHWSL